MKLLPLPLPLPLLLLTSILSVTVKAKLRISSVNEFINFKDSVNGGTNYSGTTVLLDSDLSLTGKTFESIGNSKSKYFCGTFDGQRHVISNFKMNFSSRFTGLFGYSEGLSIRNAILDSSCSITSLCKGSNNAYIGGAAGYCLANNAPCTIENSVNMGSISFTGNLSGSYSLYLGDIAGRIESYTHCSVVKSCANYGSVTHSGTSTCSRIGGVSGRSPSISTTGI